MAYRTPPFMTPPAIVSFVIAIAAANVITNVVTKTYEGAPVEQNQPVQTKVKDDNSNSDSAEAVSSSEPSASSSASSSEANSTPSVEPSNNVLSTDDGGNIQ